MFYRKTNSGDSKKGSTPLASLSGSASALAGWSRSGYLGESGVDYPRPTNGRTIYLQSGHGKLD